MTTPAARIRGGVGRDGNQPGYAGRLLARLVTDIPTAYVLVADGLSALRTQIPPGLARSPCQPGDPPGLIETWLWPPRKVRQDAMIACPRAFAFINDRGLREYSKILTCMNVMWLYDRARPHRQRSGIYIMEFYAREFLARQPRSTRCRFAPPNSSSVTITRCSKKRFAA